MQGLALVPEPLWWLLGAIVSFYFGARELHHQRTRSRGAAACRRFTPLARRRACSSRRAAARQPPRRAHRVDPDGNAAVEEWRRPR